jgi:transposase-like protein
MKIGIVIIFHNNEKEIDKKYIIKNSNNSRTIELCLVNNDSKDHTYSVLKEIKENCDNVSVVNIKKFKSESSAIRAGTRFMINQFKIKHIGYINVNKLDSKQGGLNQIIKTIRKNQDGIVEYYKKQDQNNETKKTLFQSLFPLQEYIDEFKEEKRLLKI